MHFSIKNIGFILYFAFKTEFRTKNQWNFNVHLEVEVDAVLKMPNQKWPLASAAHQLHTSKIHRTHTGCWYRTASFCIVPMPKCNFSAEQ